MLKYILPVVLSIVPFARVFAHGDGDGHDDGVGEAGTLPPTHDEKIKVAMVAGAVVAAIVFIVIYFKWKNRAPKL